MSHADAARWGRLTTSSGSRSSSCTCTDLSTNNQLHECLRVGLNGCVHLRLGALEHGHELLIELRVLEDSSTELREVRVGGHGLHSSETIISTFTTFSVGRGILLSSGTTACVTTGLGKVLRDAIGDVRESSIGVTKRSLKCLRAQLCVLTCNGNEGSNIFGIRNKLRLSWLDGLGVRVGWLNLSGLNVSTTRAAGGLFHGHRLHGLGLLDHGCWLRLGSWLSLLDHDHYEVSVLDTVISDTLGSISQHLSVSH